MATHALKVMTRLESLHLDFRSASHIFPPNPTNHLAAAHRVVLPLSHRTLYSEERFFVRYLEAFWLELMPLFSNRLRIHILSKDPQL